MLTMTLRHVLVIGVGHREANMVQFERSKPWCFFCLGLDCAPDVHYTSFRLGACAVGDGSPAI